MSYVVGNVVVQQWTILKATTSLPLTGMTSPADIEFYLHRQSGSAMVAASESITFGEEGSTGHYYTAYSPEEPGLYIEQLREKNVQTFKRWYRFSDVTVVAAGSTFMPAYANAYCAESDIERWCGLEFSGTSVPTSDQVVAFAEERASEMTAILAGAGYAITPVTVVSDSPEEDMLRAANAIAAASDALIVKFMNESPNRTEKAAQLIEEYEKRMTRLVAYAQRFIVASSIRTPMTAGELTLPTEDAEEDRSTKDGFKVGQEW